MAESIGDIINSLGVGRFTVTIMLTVGVLWISDSSELNLVSILGPELRCKWHLTSIQTSFTSVAVFLGEGIGVIYWGYLGDVYGRKRVMVVGSLMTVFFGLFSSVAPSYGWYVILRFFVGIGVGSAMFSTTYVAEFIVQKHRGKGIICLDFFYAFGSFYIASTALFMQTIGWRIFLVLAAIPATLFCCISFWLPESLHYLQNTGRYDEIVKILNRISSLNNVPVKASPYFKCISTSKLGNIRILLNKEYFWKMAIMTVVGVSSMCGYYGIVMMNTEFLQMDSFCQQNVTTTSIGCHRLDNKDYLQNLVVVASEFPGVLLLLVLVDSIGRKTCLFPGFVITGIGFLCLNFCFLRRSVIVMFILRLVLIGLSQVLFVVAAELFPTIVRTSALGIIIGICKFSFVGVPFLVQSVMHESLLAVTVIFAGPCFLSAILVLFLPETKNTVLPNI